MGGLFGVISKRRCVTDLFYGTDYHSHLGTKRGGMAGINPDGTFIRAIHSLKQSYFRVKFEDELYKFTGNSGIGVISDNESQPIIMNSHLGRFAAVTVAKVSASLSTAIKTCRNSKNSCRGSLWPSRKSASSSCKRLPHTQSHRYAGAKHCCIISERSTKKTIAATVTTA